MALNSKDETERYHASCVADEDRFRKALRRIASGNVPQKKNHLAMSPQVRERANHMMYAQHVLDGGDPDITDSEVVR